MNSVCVYCGASSGVSKDYAQLAKQVAQCLVERNIRLVYGGGDIGLMGVLANEVLRLGGLVTGVIPQLLLDHEVGHHGLTQLHVVEDMHQRKAMMASLSDGFIALPGGIGTLEELFEVLTWRQIGFHEKPVGLLNVRGFYDGLRAFLDHQVSEGFLKKKHRNLLIESDSCDDLLNRMSQSS